MKIEFDTLTMTEQDVTILRGIVAELGPIPYSVSIPSVMCEESLTAPSAVTVTDATGPMTLTSPAIEPGSITVEDNATDKTILPVEPPPKTRPAPKKAAVNTASTSDELTHDEVRKASTSKARKVGKDTVTQLIKRYGVEKLAEMDTGDYPSFMTDLEAL